MRECCKEKHRADSKIQSQKKKKVKERSVYGSRSLMKEGKKHSRKNSRTIDNEEYSMNYDLNFNEYESYGNRNNVKKNNIVVPKL
jgi:hypothetical protein